MATAILIRTSVDNGHAHTGTLDEEGNGKTSPGGPDNHTHDVIAFKVQEAGDKPHTHKIEERTNEMTEAEKLEEQQTTVEQSFILSKKRFETRQEAVNWVKEQEGDLKFGKVDETEESWRFRQREPGDFKDGSLRTIDITDGVKAVVGRLKEMKESALTAEDWATSATVRITKEFTGWHAMNAEEKRIAWGHGLRRFFESEGIPSDPVAVSAVFTERGFVYAVRALPAVLRESLAE